MLGMLHNVVYMSGEHMGGGKLCLARGIMWCTWQVSLWEAGSCAWYVELCGVLGW